MIRAFASLLLLFLFSCTDFDRSQLDNLKGEVKVIGHAGSGFHSWFPFNPYPSNSFTSIINALDDGADGIEVDVHMTSNKHFILYHDNLLESKSNGNGCPSDQKLSELKKFRYQLGLPFDWFQDESIIGLGKVVKELKRRGSQHELHLDLRNYSECHGDEWDKMWENLMLTRLHKYLKEWKYPPKKVYLITYSREMINRSIRKKLPYNICYEIVGDPEGGLKWLLKKKIKTVVVKPKLLNAEMSKILHDNGVEVITFGAKSKKGNADLLQLNPDAIQTNNVNALRELLD